MPPLYPNIVTVKSSAQIDDHIDTHLPSGWGIKDSYSTLELEEKGFAIAFEAQWYCRLPNQHLTVVKNSGFQLKTVRTLSELNRWVAAWGEADGVFNYSLLENNSIELVFDSTESITRVTAYGRQFSLADFSSHNRSEFFRSLQSKY